MLEWICRLDLPSPLQFRGVTWGGWTESSLGARDFLKYVEVHFSPRKTKMTGWNINLESEECFLLKMVMFPASHVVNFQSALRMTQIREAGEHQRVLWGTIIGLIWTPIFASLLDMITQIYIHSIYNHYSIH